MSTLYHINIRSLLLKALASPAKSLSVLVLWHEIELFVSDVIVLLMDQVSNTRTTKNLSVLLTIIMSKALMFLTVEFKK